MKKIISILLSMLVLAGALTIVWGCGSNWGEVKDVKDYFNGWGQNKQDEPDDKQNDEDNNTSFSGGSEIGEVVDNGITVLSAVLPRSAYKANGVSEQAETAYSLTAEVKPDYASDKSLDWSVAWQNGASEWATGKTVTDYVTVIPTADGASTAVCTCLQDFGEPIVLTVTSRSNTDVNGICYVQYYQRVKSCDFVFIYDDEEITPVVENGVYKVDYTGAEKDYKVELKPVYSNYTLTDTYTTVTRGSLSSTFGYTASANLNSLKITAGLAGGEPNDTDVNSLRYGLSEFARVSEDPESEGRNVQLGLSCKSIVDACNRLSYSQSTHPFYLHVKYIAEQFSYGMADYHGTQMPYVTASADISDINSCLNSYVEPAYNYYGASISSYNDFISAVKKCNSAGVGVIQYTVKINGAHSSYETVLNLSYNDEFKVNVQDVNLSDTFITF